MGKKALLTQYAQFYKIREEGGSGCPSPAIHLRTDDTTLDITHHFKGILWRFQFNLNFSKINLISRLYEQFSQNDSAKALEMGVWKNFKLLTYEQLRIILKHVIWRFRNNLYCFKRYLRFEKIREKKQILPTFFKRPKISKLKSNYILKISRLHALKLDTLCSYFKSLNFFRISFWSHCGVILQKLLIKS